MKPCGFCPKRTHCRVPHDISMMDRVMRRLEAEQRNPLLHDRLHHYVASEHCLVEEGCVDA